MKRGQLAPGVREAAPSQSAALKRAEAWAPRYAGTAAICLTADDDTGEVFGAELLSQHGQIPNDLMERIREG